ncbi:protein NLP6-like isoform X1 [Melia azedarach]|uniref:Protein NLP6-like isoform X1 n=1 Tax=Melia azedarach TaxID=155640 RepID=A0ACC1XTL7_MELAZ|nr:protein NLP6-like isoform X1 [Melia azedarach]
MDVDLDNSFVVSNPMSPFLIWSPEQPSSPLWSFSDADYQSIIASHVDIPLFRNLNTGNPNSETENAKDNDKSRMLPSPLPGLMPLNNQDEYCMIKDRLILALGYLKESMSHQQVLVQVWVPVNIGSRHVLTTSGQPFLLDPHGNGLHQYRMPRFLAKSPEWSPNVQYYSSKEYSRLDHSLDCNIRGTIVLPVFDSSGQSCIGVIELIVTTQKINYAPEVDRISKALQAVDLKSADITNHRSSTQFGNRYHQSALDEILELLSIVCETHKLPLAQTWAPCGDRKAGACTSIDVSCNMGTQVCISTSDVAFYVIDSFMWGFREACVEHHLRNGQGVAGRAFFSRSSCFCKDITQFCKSQYPLVHYARMFGLAGCFAICLRSIHNGDKDFILEFFLPPVIRDNYEQQTLLASILETVKQHLQSLKFACSIELEEDQVPVEIYEASVDRKLSSRVEYIRIPRSIISQSEPNALELPRPVLQEKQLMVNFDSLNDGVNVNVVNGTHNLVAFPENRSAGKILERKRGRKTKSTILELFLGQYCAGSLKDAANSLGVCPATLKRFCKQQEISKGPYRLMQYSRTSR